jgi:hypothetical protein
VKGGAVGDSSTLKTEWTEDQLVRLWPEMRARLLAYAYRLERSNRALTARAITMALQLADQAQRHQ